MVDPAAIASTVGGVFAGLVGGWTALNQTRNRHAGKHRDAKLDALTAELRDAKEELRKSNRSNRRLKREMNARFIEMSSQLTAFNQSVWNLAARVERLEALEQGRKP